MNIYKMKKAKRSGGKRRGIGKRSKRRIGRRSGRREKWSLPAKIGIGAAGIASLVGIGAITKSIMDNKQEEQRIEDEKMKKEIANTKRALEVIKLNTKLKKNELDEIIARGDEIIAASTKQNELFRATNNSELLLEDESNGYNYTASRMATIGSVAAIGGFSTVTVSGLSTAIGSVSAFAPFGAVGLAGAGGTLGLMALFSEWRKKRAAYTKYKNLSHDYVGRIFTNKYLDALYVKYIPDTIPDSAIKTFICENGYKIYNDLVKFWITSMYNLNIDPDRQTEIITFICELIAIHIIRYFNENTDPSGVYIVEREEVMKKINDMVSDDNENLDKLIRKYNTDKFKLISVIPTTSVKETNVYLKEHITRCFFVYLNNVMKLNGTEPDPTNYLLNLKNKLDFVQ